MKAMNLCATIFVRLLVIAALMAGAQAGIITAEIACAAEVRLSWYDVAKNEDGFIIERRNADGGDFYEVGRIASMTAGEATGENTWVDAAAQSGMCYNYRVAAYNAWATSPWNVNGSVRICIDGAPAGNLVLNARVTCEDQVDLSWSGAVGNVEAYRIERGPDGVSWPTTFDVLDPLTTGYRDLMVQPNTTYRYRVFAYNFSGELMSNVVTAMTSCFGDAESDGDVDISDLDNFSAFLPLEDVEAFALSFGRSGCTIP
jgi:hypothetical protein